MNNVVIIGLSDVADRFIRIIERHKLFNVIACAVDKQYLPDTPYISIGGGEKKKCMEYRRIGSAYQQK